MLNFLNRSLVAQRIKIPFGGPALCGDGFNGLLKREGLKRNHLLLTKVGVKGYCEARVFLDPPKDVCVAGSLACDVQGQRQHFIAENGQRQIQSFAGADALDHRSCLVVFVEEIERVGNVDDWPTGVIARDDQVCQMLILLVAFDAGQYEIVLVFFKIPARFFRTRRSRKKQSSTDQKQSHEILTFGLGINPQSVASLMARDHANSPHAPRVNQREAS